MTSARAPVQPIYELTGCWLTVTSLAHPKCQMWRHTGRTHPFLFRAARADFLIIPGFDVAAGAGLTSRDRLSQRVGPIYRRCCQWIPEINKRIVELKAESLLCRSGKEVIGRKLEDLKRDVLMHEEADILDSSLKKCVKCRVAKVSRYGHTSRHQITIDRLAMDLARGDKFLRF